MWKAAWLCWILVGLFMELIALINRSKGDTLSEQVWELLSNPRWGKFLAWMLAAFLVWMTVHFATRGKWA